MTKHTPGPWFAEVQYGLYGEDCYVSIYPAIERGFRGAVCSVSDAQNINGISRDERDANAALIVAAPDLLEALEQSITSMLDSGYNPESTVIKCASAAIAKARGES